MQKIALGGGCHWCTETVFQSLKGVSNVQQGWITSSDSKATIPSEAIIVHYDEKLIDLSILIEIHLFTHSATSNHNFREKYRSAIYSFSPEQKTIAEEILALKQNLFVKKIITKVYPFKEFTLNQEKYLDYYQKNKGKPFCETYIEPKLKLLIEKYSSYTKL